MPTSIDKRYWQKVADNKSTTKVTRQTALEMLRLIAEKVPCEWCGNKCSPEVKMCYTCLSALMFCQTEPNTED